MKLKYKFNVFHLLESYPTTEDILFEITTFLTEKNKLTEEWSDLGIKGAFHKKLDENDLQNFLDELVKNDKLIKREGSGKRNYYKIK